MTDNDKIEAFKMRLEGKSFQEIASHLGTTKQNVQQSLAFAAACGRKHPELVSKIIYPNLRKWMMENNYTILQLYHQLGYKSNNAATLHKCLRGESDIKLKTAKQIARIANMSIDELFEGGETE